MLYQFSKRSKIIVVFLTFLVYKVIFFNIYNDCTFYYLILLCYYYRINIVLLLYSSPIIYSIILTYYGCKKTIEKLPLY